MRKSKQQIGVVAQNSGVGASCETEAFAVYETQNVAHVDVRCGLRKFDPRELHVRHVDASRIADGCKNAEFAQRQIYCVDCYVGDVSRREGV